MTEIVTLSDPASVAAEAARRWVDIAQQSVEARGSFSVALSGGGTPSLLYRLLADEPWKSQISWDKTFVFWGDERRVPSTHVDSNYRMAREALLEHVELPHENIFRMPSDGLATGDSQSYAKTIRSHFKLNYEEWPHFDLILLGLGTDGHTASIFPGTRAVSDLSNMVLVYPVPKLNTERITFTLPVLNHARNILYLVTGEEKALILAEVIDGERRPSKYPAQAVNPVDGKLVWLVDAAASANLKAR